MSAVVDAGSKAFACDWSLLDSCIGKHVCGWEVISKMVVLAQEKITSQCFLTYGWSNVPRRLYKGVSLVGPTSITGTWLSGHVIVTLARVYPRELMKVGKYGVECYSSVVTWPSSSMVHPLVWFHEHILTFSKALPHYYTAWFVNDIWVITLTHVLRC